MHVNSASQFHWGKLRTGCGRKLFSPSELWRTSACRNPCSCSVGNLEKFSGNGLFGTTSFKKKVNSSVLVIHRNEHRLEKLRKLWIECTHFKLFKMERTTPINNHNSKMLIEFITRMKHTYSSLFQCLSSWWQIGFNVTWCFYPIRTMKITLDVAHPGNVFVRLGYKHLERLEGQTMNRELLPKVTQQMDFLFGWKLRAHIGH